MVNSTYTFDVHFLKYRYDYSIKELIHGLNLQEKTEKKN